MTRKTGLALQNRRRLIKLGLPGDLLSEGFWEREEEAKKREVALLAAMEAAWVSGNLGHNLPWKQIFERWHRLLENPLHFSSYGDRPRWVDALNDARAEMAAQRNGRRKECWAKASKAQNEKEVQAKIANGTFKWRLKK